MRSAVEAINLTPMCADAFILLAEGICYNASDRLLLLQWATRVGEICCQDKIAENSGHLHAFLDARPYLRARLQLAQTFRELGCYEEAINHFEALLKMERNYHISRAMLMIGYLELRRFHDAENLYRQYAELGGIDLHYGEYVRLYLLGSSDSLLKEALKRALKRNSHVPALLESPTKLVERSPFGVVSGAPDEAADFLAASHRLWAGYTKMKRSVIKGAKNLLPIIEREKQDEARAWKEKYGAYLK